MKKYLLSLLLLTSALTMSATMRPTAKMQQAASKVMNGSKAQVTLSKPTLDVFNDGNRFAIVSRDDRFPEILAYGMGNFDIEKAPANVKWWFEAVQRCMENAVKQNAPRRAAVAYTAVEPFITTKWGQSTPYNNYCPVFEADKTKAPSGCVATAMAQIINYWQYPASATFEGGYSIDKKDKTVQVASTYSFPYQLAYGIYLPTADADPEEMKYTPSQGNKVATLMRDCGYSVNMNYTADGSGASTVAAGNALATKFSYPKDAVRYVNREWFTDEAWMKLIQTELANKSPILYAGGSEDSGGHAFVFHGMDTEGKVFVNWGWQGQYDGYYAIDLLTPGDDDFSLYQEAVVGIRSKALDGEVYHSFFYTNKPYTFKYDQATTELSVTLVQDVYNMTCHHFTGRWSLVIEDMNNPEKTEILDLLEEGTTVEYFRGYEAQTLSLGKGTFDPGTYRLYMATEDTGEASWQYVQTVGGGMYYELTAAADGTVTLASTPTYTDGHPNLPSTPTVIRKVKTGNITPATAPVRYYDLQGREVNAGTKGLVIRKQGNEVKKVVVR